MKWMNLIGFIIYGTVAVFDVDKGDYTFALAWCLLALLELAFFVIEELRPKKVDNTQKALEALVDELRKADLRKYTCINDSGYSQVERNIIERILKL